VTSTLVSTKPITMTPEMVVKFHSLVSIVPVTGCWMWMGPMPRKDGYGQIRMMRNGKRDLFSAHRFAYTALRGQIADGMTIDHLCKHPWCVNPEHLEQVTMRENLMRGSSPSAIAATATHCKNGHLFTHADRHQRRCRTCQMAQSRRRSSRCRMEASA